MQLGERLAKLRNEKGLTQKELSAILSMSRSTYAQYETNSRQPDYETLSQLADYFNVSIDWLIKGNYPPSLHESRIEYFKRGSVDVGDRLKKIREEKGLTQKQVAEMTGLVHATLANWEIGRTEPDIESIRILSNFYNISSDYFIHGNKLPIPNVPKYEDLGKITLEEEFAKKGLSRETQREVLESALRIVEETRKKYNKPRK